MEIAISEALAKAQLPPTNRAAGVGRVFIGIWVNFSIALSQSALPVLRSVRAGQFVQEMVEKPCTPGDI